MDVCGILGIYSLVNEPVAPLIHKGLKRLEYRGYDSVGIATVWNGDIHVKKDKGSIDDVHSRLDLDLLPGNIGVGHTRWATHGTPSMINAHPHMDCTRKIAIVHNGIIENYLELKKRLVQNGHTFLSDTDSEVIVHLIEEEMKKGKSLPEAVHESVKQLEGSYAIVVISAGYDGMVGARKESPLVVGLSHRGIFLASDFTAFLEYTRNAIVLRDGEMIIVKRGMYEIRKIGTWEIVKRGTMEIPWDISAAEKEGYPHFYLKEVHEQPTVIKNLLSYGKRELAGLEVLFDGIERIQFIACGTSYHAGLYGAYLFAKENALDTEAIIASEYPFRIGKTKPSNTLAIAISQSGETADTIAALKIAKSRGIRILGIVNVVGSTITRIANKTFYIHAGPEISVAATKSYTAQLTALAMISAYLSKNKEMQHAIEALPRHISSAITWNSKSANLLAKHYLDRFNYFFLGRGLNTPTAMEGALKIKEIAYVHAEAYPAGESKHGPIALINRGFPVIFTAPNDDTFDLIRGNMAEMKSRGGDIIATTDKGAEKELEIADHLFIVPPTHSSLSPILHVIPLQLFAYYAALHRGCEIDKPRNLAKSVTVK